MIHQIINFGNEMWIREMVETGVGEDCRPSYKNIGKKRKRGILHDVQEQHRASNVIDGHRSSHLPRSRSLDRQPASKNQPFVGRR